MSGLDPHSVAAIVREALFVGLIVGAVKLRPWRWLASLLRAGRG